LPTSKNLAHRSREFLLQLQEGICSQLERVDGKARFVETRWSHTSGGGGVSRVLQHGGVFGKAGVNYSAVSSQLTETLASRLDVSPQAIEACGISLVLHPESPMIPTVHMNLRYLELENGDSWFGGGMDLTPYYLFDEDAGHFHRTLKSVCDNHNRKYYPQFKKWCDDYFHVRHRMERRGIGGIFFDYQRDDPEQFFSFVKDVGVAFVPAYIPIVERRRSEPWTDKEKEWQLIRRGRYVEFNLIYDRGTLFGLETQGRAESILMSLPPEVKWPYDYQPELDSREAKLIDVLQNPREWT
jgi:coproporphyrinogen III oxidase